MSELPLWLQYAQAAALVALAIVAGVIAYRQWRTAHDMLRLDLFDRRFEVYIRTLDFIGAVMQDGYPANEHYRPFARVRDRAQYLFGQEVEVLLDQINKTAAVLRVTHGEINQGQEAKKEEATEKNRAALATFSEFDTELMNVMQPYLSFDDIRRKTVVRRVIERVLAFVVVALLLVTFLFGDKIRMIIENVRWIP